MRGFKKILRVILALLSVSVLMIGGSMTVFASESETETMTYDEWASTLDFSSISVPETYDYVICFGSENSYVLYLCNYPTYAGENGYFRINCNLLDDGSYGDSGRARRFVSSNGYDWTFKFYVDDSTHTTVSGDTFIYRNHDIKDFSGNVVFPLPVRPLVKVAQMITPEMILGQIVGLLPLLILFVIGLAAFWKGWQVLSSTLRRA